MMPTRCLAIETSSQTGSIALRIGEEILERTIATPREQTALVLEIVDDLLGRAGIGPGDLDALVFGRGPGSFTGLRVAAAVVQGLSFASGVPIVPVSSLAALAQRGFDALRHQRGAPAGAGRAGEADLTAPSAAGSPGATGTGPDRALCCVDARMGEVYWASFRLDAGLAVPDSDERIGPPGAVTAPDRAFIALGDGFAAYEPPALAPVSERALTVDASAVPGARELLALSVIDIEAGRFVPLDAAVPVYLRDSAAWHRF